MAITNFIPTVWSENLCNQLEKKYIGVANCNRDWEGDIKQCGDRVKICSLGSVSVFDYKKNTDIPAPAALNDSARELIIDQAKAFNFQIDDIDSAQTKPNLMDVAVRNAADALSNLADHYVYSLHSQVDESHTIYVSDGSNITDCLFKAIISLKARGVKDEMVLEVSPVIAAKIFKEKLNILSDNTPLLENGCIGSIAGCKIFITPNINVHAEGDISIYHCYLRTKRAIAFAEQLSEIEAYRPENRFADAVKGLHLYGAKIVYPDEITVINIENNDFA